MSKPRTHGAGEPLRTKKKRRRRKWLLYTLLVMLGLALGAAGVAGSFVYKAAQNLPSVDELDPNLTSVIYDSKGQVVSKLYSEENRTLIKDIKDVPPDVLQAFIDTEDRRFYEHKGVDMYRMVGAVLSTAKYYLGVKGSQVEGGSTITMQLAGNAFLDRSDQSLTRKVQEMLLAFELEKKYTKEEILLRYLNQIPFGRLQNGLEEAAHHYYSKSAKELTLSEAAVLAGMLKGPSIYNPIDNPEGAMERRNIVLDLMVLHGHLDADKAASMKTEPIVARQEEADQLEVGEFNGDWYIDYVQKILTEPAVAAKYGTPLFDDHDLRTKGLKIYTALDLEWQKIAQQKMVEVVTNEATKTYGTDEIPEAAVVIMDHKTGHVKALIGGMKHVTQRGYNRATDAVRQPGSAMKPLVDYLPAIDLLGWGPSTVIDDSPPMLNADKDNVWPENYEFRYSGLVPMRYALEQSINAVAVRTLQQVTPKKGIEYARLMGISTLRDAGMNPAVNDENLSLALGGITDGVSPLELTAAYGVLGSLGLKTDPVVITKIEDKDGVTIFEATPRKKQVIRKESVWLMVDIMKGAIVRGTPSQSLKGWHGWPAAGKTGTTEKWHDAWFVGFTSDIVTGVWTGYDNNDGQQRRLPTKGWQSWTGAGPPALLWGTIMDEIVKEKPADWERPTSGLVAVQICKSSGLLPSPMCPKDQIITDWFRKGAEPKQFDDKFWTMAKVVKQPFKIPGSEKSIDRYYLWQEGCTGTPEDLLLINRPTTYVKHPTDPWNFNKYWPADWWKEVPTEKCPVVAPVVTPPGNGVTPPGNGTTPPGNGTTPPGNGTTPPGNGTNPPGNGTNPPGGGLIPVPPLPLPGN
ncbi:MAG TPA: PBP1A family penicillin-binding protein [Symbiobacteriaceae bacterium]|nr:PBP1A family penicillin-binding protein [Symbiobacteriaceae bacterium]